MPIVYKASPVSSCSHAHSVTVAILRIVTMAAPSTRTAPPSCFPRS